MYSLIIDSLPPYLDSMLLVRQVLRNLQVKNKHMVRAGSWQGYEKGIRERNDGTCLIYLNHACPCAICQGLPGISTAKM
jgi:hypothetical protein